MTTETVHSAPGIEAEKLVRMYRQMVAIRLFEERVERSLYARPDARPRAPVYR